jgi:putative ABC transport system permease protein
VTAAPRASLADLPRRRARTVFTVLTLALAVASIGIFAVPRLMSDAMRAEVAANRLPDVSVSMPPLRLTAADLAALERLPNVAAVEPRSLFVTRVWVGARRERAVVVGVRDHARQRADIVSVVSGAAPAVGEVLTDRVNGWREAFGVGTGDRVRLVAAGGGERTLRVSGVARNLTNGEDDPSNDWITFYATTGTVAALSGRPGYTTLGIRLETAGRAEAARAVAAVRGELRARTAFTAFDDLPLVQEPGGYPGKESFESLASLFTVITLLALLSALVLISNTMTTLVGEQTAQIATMKAIGARRRDIRRLYLRTALVLGALGATAGVLLGVVLANLLTRYFASMFFGIDAGVGVSVPVVAASLLLGVAGPPLAALPAVRRAARLPLVEALNASGSAVGGQGRLDALLRRVRGLPHSAQIGLRGLGRRARRSAATALQVSIAVATLLALLAVGTGVGETTRQWFDDSRYDVWVHSTGGRHLGPEALDLVASTAGVREVQPWLQNQVRIADGDAEAWGLPARPFIDTRIREGRWYTAQEAGAAAPVAVLGPALAARIGAAVGDPVEVTTAGGPVTLRVVGVSGSQTDNGGAIFLPLGTLQRALGAPGAVNSHWIRTTSSAEAAVDRTTTRVEDALTAAGEQVGTLVVYDTREEQVAANGRITTAITVLGMLVVAISLVALVNTITMAVLERTREIGMLRGVGARARDVRAIFATEGIAIAVAGWALGVPLGYALARALVWAVGEAVGIDVAWVFPPANIAVALVGTVALAVLVILAPVRRAVRLRPGDALRVG